MGVSRTVTTASKASAFEIHKNKTKRILIIRKPEQLRDQDFYWFHSWH
jgi:hypothetical protein